MRKYFLETERTSFSTWKLSDINLAKSLWGDKNVTAFLSITGIFSEKEIIDRLDLEINNYNFFNIQYFPVFESKTNKFIGCCGLKPYNLKENIYEIGFHLMKDYWGKGFGIEIAEAIIKYAFEKIGAKNLFAGHNPRNIGSKKILEKLGFNYIGKEFYPPTGLEHPSYLYYLINN